jgi:hypothetical protein
VNSWHFLENYLVLVSGDENAELEARTIEAGKLVSCRLPRGATAPVFDQPGSANCQHACADAIWQRKSKTGFKSAGDVLDRFISRWGNSSHEVGGVSYALEKDGNGDVVARVNIHFDTYCLRLNKDGSYEIPFGSPEPPLDREVERAFDTMRALLSKRRDWDMASKLA